MLDRRFEDALIAVTVTANALAGILVCCRICGRRFVGQSIRWCDVFISLALLLSIAFTVSACWNGKISMDQPPNDLSDADRNLKVKAMYVAMIVFDLGLSFSKIAVAFQCVKVFLQHRILLCCWIFLGAMSAYALTILFLNIFISTPSSIEYARCMNCEFLWIATAAINTATDVAAVFLALPLFWEFQLVRVQRYALMATFGLGISTCVFSALRLESLVSSLYADADADLLFPDDTFYIFWTTLELNTAIACSCLPTLGNICRLTVPDFRRSSYDDRSIEETSLEMVRPASSHMRKSFDTMTRALSVCTPTGYQGGTTTPESFRIDPLGPPPSPSQLPNGQIFVHTVMNQVEEIHEEKRCDFGDGESTHELVHERHLGM